MEYRELQPQAESAGGSCAAGDPIVTGGWGFAAPSVP